MDSKTIFFLGIMVILLGVIWMLHKKYKGCIAARDSYQKRLIDAGMF